MLKTVDLKINLCSNFPSPFPVGNQWHVWMADSFKPCSAAPSPKLSDEIKNKQKTTQKKLNKVRSSFADAQPRAKSWPWPRCCQILGGKNNNNKAAYCITERVTWCQLPSITEVYGTRAGRLHDENQHWPCQRWQFSGKQSIRAGTTCHLNSFSPPQTVGFWLPCFHLHFYSYHFNKRPCVSAISANLPDC